MEQQLREELHHEGETIGTAGSTLVDITARGRRRKAWKVTATSFLAVVLVGGTAIGVASIGGGSADPGPTARSTSAPTTTSALTITEAPSTTAANTGDTTVAGPPALPVPVGVATPQPGAPTGYVVVNEDGVTTEIFAGRFAALAADGFGGLVFQAQVSTEDTNRERGSIYRVVAGTTEPVPIVEQAQGHVIAMQSVEIIDDAPTLLYTDAYGYESPETARVDLMGYDLSSGDQREIAIVGGWESGILSVSYGGGVLVLDAASESERSWRFLDADGRDVATRFNPNPACEAGDIRCPSAPTMSPDGRLVYARSVFFDLDGAELDLSNGEYVMLNDNGIVIFDGGEETLIEEYVERVEIVAVDVASGSERLLVSLFRERVEGRDGAAFVSLDYDGRYLIVNDRNLDWLPRSVVIDTDDVAYRWPLPVGGEAVFPPAGFDIPGIVVSPIG